MNLILDGLDDDSENIAKQMQQNREKLRSLKRSQHTNNQLRNLRERAYFNGYQQDQQQQYQQIQYDDEYQQQIQMMNFFNNDQGMFNYAQMQGALQHGYQQQEGYDNFYGHRQSFEPHRHVYDFSMIPQQNLNANQILSENILFSQQYPNISSQQYQQHLSQQYKENYTNNKYQLDSSMNTVLRVPQHQRKQYIIEEDYDNEEDDEETKDCYIYENLHLKNKQPLSSINNTVKQLSKHKNLYRSDSPKRVNPISNQYQNEVSRFDDYFSASKATQKFFATEKSNNQIITTPQVSPKLINDLSSVRVGPRNQGISTQYNNNQLFQYKEQQQQKQAQNCNRFLFDQATMIDQVHPNIQNEKKLLPQVYPNNQANYRNYPEQKVWKDQGYDYKRANKYTNGTDQKQNTKENQAQNNNFYGLKKQTNDMNQPVQLVMKKGYEFNINKKIGEGSFSQVYLGYKQGNPDIPVAVKIIDLQKQGTKFRDEIQICMKVNGNMNILRIYDHLIEQSNNKCYLFLEYCNQGNLQNKLENITRRQAIIYFRQIVDGMKELFKHSIIHRDIKLENILIKDGQIKISDFGLSKQMNNKQLDVNSVKCGTPSTMAPEIYFSNSNYPSYNNKCDVWSLGVILHEMFYQIHPFNMNKEMLRNFQRTKVQNKCDIVEDFLSKSLVQSQKKRMSLEEMFNHHINTADLSKFKLLDEGKLQQQEHEYLKQQRLSKHIVNQEYKPVVQNDILQSETVQSNIMNSGSSNIFTSPNKLKTQQGTFHSNSPVKNNQIEAFSLLKSIIFESLRGNNLTLTFLFLLVIGLLISIIAYPFFKN